MEVCGRRLFFPPDLYLASYGSLLLCTHTQLRGAAESSGVKKHYVVKAIIRSILPEK